MSLREPLVPAGGGCQDCHSNQTRWPPHSFLAPFSWMVAGDVEQGREALNFSTWDEDDGEADDAAEVVPTPRCRPAATYWSTPARR
jgi:Haem-binding domain